MGTGFLSQCIYNYRGLCTWLNWPAFLSNTLFRPFLLVLTFALVARFARGGEAEHAVVLGMIAYSATTILSGGILQCFANERMFGTLSFLFAAPGGRLRSYLSRALPHYPGALLCFASGLCAAVFVLDTDFSGMNWPAAVLSLAAIALSVSLFCLFLGALCLMFRDWLVAAASSEAALLILTGVIIPRGEMPAALAAAGNVLPITHGLDGLRRAVSGSAVGDISAHLATEVLVGISYMVVGYVLFRVYEIHACRTGNYESA